MVYLNVDIASIDVGAALRMVSPQRREKALRYRQLRDRQLSLAVYLLLLEGLAKEYGIRELPDFAFGPHGKPCLANHPRIHFNLSHCREAALCVIGDTPVGCDVETVPEELDMDLCKRCFNPAELALIEDSARPTLAFARLWTQKEAFLKLTGEGLADGLPDLLGGGRTKNVFFETHTAPGGRYAYTICKPLVKRVPSSFGGKSMVERASSSFRGGGHVVERASSSFREKIYERPRWSFYHLSHLTAFLALATCLSSAPAQQPRLTAIAVQSSPDAAVVTVHGTGAPSTAYQLDWTPVLANDAVWMHAGDAVAGEDGSFSIRATPLQQPGFYRVAAESFDFGIYSVTQSGNAVLNAYGNAFAALGFEYGDVIRASVEGRDYRMPVVSAYAEVDSGDMLCRVVLAEDEGQSAVVLAINGGNFAQTAGVGTNQSIKIEMDEKGGYLDEYILRHLGGTTNRADYADLTDEQYANFRPVAAPGIAAGTLYRSSSPVNPVLNRNREADAALDGAGVRSVLNLADTEEAMKAYPGFAETHYAERTILPLAMTMDYMSGEFRDKLAAALRFIAASDGPWLVHCSHGKDRTGFLCAVLECLAGADADAVVADYMESYVDLYHLTPGSDQYETIAEGNIVKELQEAFGLPDIRAEGVDLAEAARTYLVEGGLEEGEIDAVLVKLSAGGE